MTTSVTHPRRKRKVDPHDPFLPLSIWIPRGRVFAQTCETLRLQSKIQAATCLEHLPKGWSLTTHCCRIRCPACPHHLLSKRGFKGRSLSLATAQLSRKYSVVENLLDTQKQLEHFSALAMMRVKALSRDSTPSVHAEGDFTPIPFHLLAWKIIENNRKVIELQHSVRDWNTEHNRAHKNKVTRQGALGFKIRYLSSGAFVPFWTIWTRGSMGQWIGHQKATPTYGKGFKNPNRTVPIPTRLTALTCAKTGNKNCKTYYLSRESDRAELLEKIRALNTQIRSLSKLFLSASSIKVK